MDKLSANQVIELLREQRKNILAGNFSALIEIDMLATVSDYTPEKLRMIVTLSKENQNLLAASLTGMKDAQQRIATIRDNARNLLTYSEKGQRVTTSSTVSKVEVKF